MSSDQPPSTLQVAVPPPIPSGVSPSTPINPPFTPSTQPLDESGSTDILPAVNRETDGSGSDLPLAENACLPLEGREGETFVSENRGRSAMLDAVGGFGRGKMCNDKAGWGSLPLNVLHSIISHATEGVHVEQRLHDRWPATSRSQSFELIQAWKKRMRLCDLRRVCTGWRDAVDSHAFWPDFAVLFNPSHHQSAILDEFRASRVMPSTTTASPLFYRARADTIHVCLICRINHPDRLRTYPADRKCLSLTHKFGRAPICERHHDKFCSSCMMEAFDIRATLLIANSNMICPANWRDIDEYGNERPYGALVCRGCRRSALDMEILRILKQCARGGPLRGLTSSWVDIGAVGDYLDFNVSIAAEVAYAAVEEQWLIDHTRWNELKVTAHDLQDYERLLKTHFLSDQTTESRAGRRMRLAWQAELRGEDLDAQEIEKDALEMERMYRGWWKDMTKNEVDVMDEDGDDFEDDGEEDTLGMKYRNKLRSGCINDFIDFRVRSAFWVMPSDEVHKLAVEEQIGGRIRPSVIHTNLDDLARHCIHPFQKRLKLEYDNLIDGIRDVGWISLQTDSTNPHRDPFLPPERLLRELDDRFSTKLRSRTGAAMNEIVRILKDRFRGDDDRTESHCAEMRTEDLLRMLGEEKLWLPRGMEDLDQLEMDKRLWEEKWSGKGRQNLRRSPRVEMEMEDTGPVDYGIKEEALTPSVSGDDDAWIKASPTLGKRKSPPDDEGDFRDASSEKRSRSSSDSEDEQSETKTTRIITPHKQTHDGTDLDGDGDSSGLRKRKLPPWPESHHIDRSQRQITPPPPPKFVVEDATAPSSHPRPTPAVTRVMLDMDPASSAPASPSPIMGKRPAGGVSVALEVDMGTKEDQEQRLDDEAISPVALTDGTLSSSGSAGTLEMMPITPEMEEWSDSVSVVHVPARDSKGDVKLSAMVAHTPGTHSLEQNAQVPGQGPVAEKNTLFVSLDADLDQQVRHASSASTPAADSTSVEDDISSDKSVIDTATKSSKPPPEIPADPDFVEVDADFDDEDEESSDEERETETMMERIRAEFNKRIIARQFQLQALEPSVPWIPQPFIHPHQTVPIPVINLGPGATGTLMSGWYEARSELRECRCRICERARIRAWNNMAAISRAVGEGWGILG
ncbi:hypothetical protein IAR55_001389 [Kwoniella newhampshirensis]|uniref:F-box domain-containing protein n=1 Tax=Kwoniella newhampshirensis TaxID=1651941 RepID=A0AAW0Z211_9TREE